jgi:lambda family phage portal protein
VAKHILDEFGRPLPNARERQLLRAKPDAARTNVDNMRHWANADNLSPAAAVSDDVRKITRSRARYEAQENSSYAKGMMLTMANDTIGTGPRLEMLSSNDEANERIEVSFQAWAKEMKLAEKLRTMRMSKGVDGEVFALEIANRKLRHPIKLDYRLYEGDQVATPTLTVLKENEIDGIRFDRYGNPVEYDLLEHHPGADVVMGMQERSRVIPASRMIHLFRCDRPEQRRGITELLTALPLFAMLRRFTQATLAAAETAANFAAVMFTDSSVLDEVDCSVDPMDSIPMEPNSMLTLPQGWRVGQVDAEQPTTTYDSFHDKLLNEVARCMNVPFNVVAGNSSGYNFASGRLDHQIYFKSIDVERSFFECNFLDRALASWFDEAVLVGGIIPDNIGMLDEVPHRWFWDHHEHIDPLKQASADTIYWNAGLTTDQQLLSKRGIDPDQHYKELSVQMQKRKELDLPVPGGQSPVVADGERDG